MNLLYIGDCHFPFQHPDTFDFLDEIRRVYRPEIVVQIGDIVDLHGPSFHDAHPELPGPRDEFEAAKVEMQRFEKLFPHTTVTEGNHGLRPERVAKKMGMLPEMVTDKNTLWGTPTLHYTRRHVHTLPDGSKIVAVHGDKGCPPLTSNSRRGACHTVAGHRHTEGGIRYYVLGDGSVRWAAQTGCLVDDDHPAFDYTPYRSVLGSLVIEDATPVFLPLKLDRRGRWTGRL